MVTALKKRNIDVLLRKKLTARNVTALSLDKERNGKKKFTQLLGSTEKNVKEVNYKTEW